MYQALYRKYRPKILNDVCGQDTIVRIINNSITNNKINHAYLFTGPRGTGKTSIAKIFARMVNCENLKNGIPCGKCTSCTQKNNSDIIEIDAASNNGVDEIRELRNKVNLVPSYGKYKIYIVDEVHMLTTGAFNALLKTLEEPPEHIIFILATTDPHKIPETILSRCQRLDFKKISENNIVKRLKEITKEEKIDIEEEALFEIARLADGGMRDSIGILDQVNAYSESKIIAKDVHDINGTLTPLDLKELIYLINNNDLEKILKKLDFLNDCGKNFVKLTEEIISFMRNVLITKEAPDYFKEINSNFDIYKEISEFITTKDILKYIEILNDALSQMKITNNPKLLLELAIIKIANRKTIEEQPPLEIEKTQNKEKTIISQEIIKQKKEKKVEEPEKIISQEIEKKKETVTPAPQINIEKLEEIKEIRINNTLAKFKKKNVLAIKEKILLLNDYLLNPDYSKYASIILDGTLKAASEENLIFVYKNERLSSLFNENIIGIEETISKVLDNKYKVIATDADSWEKIKNDFNSKKKEYSYKEEKIKIEDIFKNAENETEFSAFEDIIEYN